MSEPFIGEIRMVGFNFSPQGWADCDGQLLPIRQNTSLYGLLGTAYGGDGRTTFALPDFRGRVPVHLGGGPGLTNRRLGERRGAEQHQLTVSQMPSHRHTIVCIDEHGDQTSPVGHMPAVVNSLTIKPYGTDSAASRQVMDADMVAPTGGGQSFNLMQPYLVVRFVIALHGINPVRAY